MAVNLHGSIIYMAVLSTWQYYLHGGKSTWRYYQHGGIIYMAVNLHGMYYLALR